MEKRKTMLVLLFFCHLMGHQSMAQEDKFKALFLYKFVEYTEWPTGTREITIGVVGESPVYNELAGFAASKENLTVVKIQSSAEVKKCEVVFLPNTKNNLLDQFNSTIGSSSILLVSEDGDLVGQGSDIGFYLEGGKLRFLISEKDIKEKKMIPNSKLMALGKSI